MLTLTDRLFLRPRMPAPARLVLYGNINKRGADSCNDTGHIRLLPFSAANYRTPSSVFLSEFNINAYYRTGPA